MEEKQNDINVVAMEVILNAGNGRECIDQALVSMAKFNFDEAEELLKEAESKVLKAHIAQTKVIQSQVSGEETEYSLLFIHAQDTIMTINTELRMTLKMMPIFKALYNEKEKKDE